MGTVEFISNDGTRLACRAAGSGPPLVLVHGTGGSSARWAPILPALEEHFSVYALDRRGRGNSGDATAYALEREAEDVAAVVSAIGQPAHMLGHSFGGICALEAALLTSHVRKLILYESPIPVEGMPIQPEGMIDRLEALLAAGDREAVLTAFLQAAVRMPPHEFEAYRASPVWPARLAAAHTLPRELRAQGQYRFAAERFAHLDTPALLLVGGDSPAPFQAAIRLLEAALPNSRTIVLPGQQHIAMDTAPELFVREVTTFLTEP
jgi:pimeloyl-ACP methyl ester carboxylesterase